MNKSIVIKYLLENYSDRDLDNLLDWNEIISSKFKISNSKVLDKIRTTCAPSNDKINVLNLVALHNIAKSYKICQEREEDSDYYDLFCGIMRKYNDKVGKSFKFYIKKCFAEDPDSFVGWDIIDLNSLMKIGLANSICKLNNVCFGGFAGILRDINHSDISSTRYIKKLVQAYMKSYGYYAGDAKYSRNVVLLKYIVKYYPSIEITNYVDPKCLAYLNKKFPNDKRCEDKNLRQVQRYVREKKLNTWLKLLRMILQRFTSRNMSKLILYHV